MCVSPWVLLAVADRLAADRDHWQAFAPQNYFPDFLDYAASLLYPDADELWQDKGTASFLEMNQ
jgi:hypothetical protein